MGGGAKRHHPSFGFYVLSKKGCRAQTRIGFYIFLYSEFESKLL
jgi:hypothetical protein